MKEIKREGKVVERKKESSRKKERNKESDKDRRKKEKFSRLEDERYKKEWGYYRYKSRGERERNGEDERVNKIRNKKY